MRFHYWQADFDNVLNVAATLRFWRHGVAIQKKHGHVSRRRLVKARTMLKDWAQRTRTQRQWKKRGVKYRREARQGGY